MINQKTVTAAVEALLKQNLQNYLVERNPLRPDEPWKATVNKAWIGVYRGPIEYEARAIGPVPWLAEVQVIIEVQVASITSSDDCEDRLLDAEKAVLDVINTNRTLSGVVDMVMGYSVAYEINQDTQTHYQAAIITVRAQARTS